MIPVLIIGKSGSGKSASLRNLPKDGTMIINVLGKPLPFKSNLHMVQCTDYEKLKAAISKGEYDRYVIDDAGYLITSQFMLNHSSQGKGNEVYALYNDLADQFWTLIRTFQKNTSNSRVYLMMHEDKNEVGDIKPKTIGKLLDDKVCLEGMFTICLRATINNGEHVFKTQSNGFDVAKSPIGMFDTLDIPNDLNMVDEAITEYYEIGGKNNA